MIFFMARHCSSVTVVVVGAVGAVGSTFSVDSAGDIGGAGDVGGACSMGGAGGAGDAVADAIDVDASTAVSNWFAASAVSGAISAAASLIAGSGSCLSLFFGGSAIAIRRRGMVLGWGFMALPKY